MTQKQLLIFLFLSTLLLSGCKSNNQFTDDTAIQKDITISVNNYNSDNWEIRLESIKSISKYSNSIYAKNSLLLVFKAIDDSHSEVRIDALKILKPLKAPAVEEKIGNMALTDENSNVRYFAFIALGEYGNIKNEAIFIQGLNDRDWLVKEASLKGLMNINDPEIQLKHLDIILNAINDKHLSIKITAITNINFKDPLIYNEFARIINNTDSGTSILKAALDKIKGYKLDNKTKKRIIELLTHRDKNIRILSLQALKQEELNIDI